MNQQPYDEKHYSILYIGSHIPKSRKYVGSGETIANNLSDRGWSIILSSRKEKKLPRLLDMMWTIFSRQNAYHIAIVDVFSGLSFYWAYITGLLLKLLNRPFLLVLRGGALPEFSKSHKKIITSLFSWALKVISPSAYLREKLFVFRDDIELIPNGLAINRYSYSERRASLNRLIWLRAFHEIYNPSLLLDVIDVLISDGHNLSCTMIGPDRGDSSLQDALQKIDSRNLNRYIDIIPGIEKFEVPAYLSEADIFLNTTNVDNTPVSVIEAMACGLCIVSTNVGGIPYLLEDGVDAMLVPPEDPQAMANAVKRILADPQLAAALSANARKKAESFSWERVLPMWEALFHEILGESEDH